MQNDPSHPWIFQRDEFYLIEEDIDEIFHRFIKKDGFKIENSVIEEQMEAEELSDVEFTLKMSEGLFENKNIQAPAFRLDKQFETERPQPENQKRNSLYEGSLVWSNAVFAFAKKLYDKKFEKTEDVFRVYFNVKFVPLKLSIVHADEMADEFSLDIAEKEFELTKIYLERVLESLSRLVFVDSEKVVAFLSDGEKIKKHVEETLVIIKKRKQSKPGFYE